MTQEEIYARAEEILETAETERDCLRAEEMFKSILGYTDSGAMVAACRMKADEIRAVNRN